VTSIARMWLPRVMEALWLMTAGLVPLLFARPDFMLFLDVPKTAVLRVLTGLMALLWVVEWGLGTRETGMGVGGSLVPNGGLSWRRRCFFLQM
jgi:hypothetical protein